MDRKKKEQMIMPIVNPNAAGIDVGSRSHFVAVGQRSEDVREFGVYSEDLQTLCHWLKEKNKNDFWIGRLRAKCGYLDEWVGCRVRDDF